MSEKMKKIGVLLVLILLFTVVLSGCGSKATETPPEATEVPAIPEADEAGEVEPAESAAAGKVKISFALWDEVQKPVFDTLVKQFNEENPDIEVEVQLTPWSQYWTKLDAAAGAKTAPDVFWMNVYLPKYTDAGIIEPLDSYIEKDGIDKAQWVPSMLELYSDKGVQYGLPKGMDVVVVAYNKRILDKYDVAYPEEGWSWDDFVAKGAELRDKITEAGGDEYAVAIELDSQQPSYLQLLVEDGLKIYSDDGLTTDLNDPKAVKAFADLVGLIDEKILPEYTVLSDTKGTDLFISEKAGLLYVGSWKASVLDSASFAENIGLIPLPKRENNNVALGGISYAISAFSEHKDAAWKLAKFLAGPESNKLQAEERIEIPAYIAVQDSYGPTFEHIDGSIFIEQSKSAVKYPIHRALATTTQIISDHAATIFLKEVTPEEGVAAMAKDVQDAIDEYNETQK